MFHPTAAARVLALVVAALAASQTIWAENLLLNPGAEQGKGENPSLWERASVAADGLKMVRTGETVKSGKESLMIANDHKYDKPVANNWMQSLQKVPHGAALRVAAAIRTRDADSANVCLQCWDVTGEKMLAFGTTPVIRGDQDWIRVTSNPVIVPAATASIIIRAALLGTGTVWFDDLEVTPERQANLDNQAADASADSSESDSPKASESDLLKKLPGKLIERVPITKDCMVLAYLKEWSHGEVDNIAVANNDGGVRTLLAWKPLPAKTTEGPNRRVYLAVYSRKTTDGKDPSEIVVSPISTKWPERTSWETQPKIDPAVDAVNIKVKFEPGNGWKLIDITPMLRKKSSANQFGLMLKFKDENQSAEKHNWSGYELVSREGLGEGRNRHPQLLVVETAPKGNGNEKK
jgi:hypothetical protein